MQGDSETVQSFRTYLLFLKPWGLIASASTGNARTYAEAQKQGGGWSN